MRDKFYEAHTSHLETVTRADAGGFGDAWCKRRNGSQHHRPDGAVVVTVQTASGNLNYSVTYRGVTVIETSPLGTTVNTTNLGAGVTIASTSSYSTNETFPSRHGIHAVGMNNYQAQLIALNHPTSSLNYFLNDNGTQTSCVLPLAFGMVPDEFKAKVFAHLVEKITVESDNHLGTGLIGGHYLMRVLSDNGRPDLAYTIATQTT